MKTERPDPRECPVHERSDRTVRSVRGAGLLAAVGLLWLMAGCGGAPTTEKPAAEKIGTAGGPKGGSKPVEVSTREAASGSSGDSASGSSTSAPAVKKKRKFEPISLEPAGSTAATASTAGNSATTDQSSAKVIEQLQTFQILLGKWNWTTKKTFGSFAKHGEDMRWVWDFRTDRNLPALTFTTEQHPYFVAGALTYLPAEEKFRLTTQSPEKQQRVFVGTWADGGEPMEEHDGKKTQRRYKLELKQTEPAEGEQWKVVFNQLDNDQFLMDVTRRPATGSNYTALDVVRQQREGTSFAAVDSDNPGPKCIVSGGLGSMTVTYQGKSYPVCCTGCAAAFNDDPERWLKKMAAKENGGTGTDKSGTDSK